jgi:hypothetical protein
MGVLSLPATASADPSDITILSITNSAGFMTVTTASGTPITDGSVTVHLTSNNGSIPPITDFSRSGSNGNQESWQTQNPITGLSPGIYPATVDAADGSGSQTGLPGGNFSFLIQTAVTLTAKPASVDFDHPTVVFSGHATQTQPTSSTPEVLPGKQISIIGPAGPGHPYIGTTDGNGNYKVSVKPAPGGYYAQVPASSTMAASPKPAQPQASVTATVDQVRLSAKFRHPTINYRQDDTITGSVKYRSGGTLKPLAHATVTISRASQPGKPTTATTDAKGNFSATERRLTTGGSWTVKAGGTALLGKAQVMLALNVRQLTGFRHVRLSLSADRHVTARACLVVTSQGSHGRPVNSPVTLQYSTHGSKGPWRKAATIRPAAGTKYCAAGSPDWRVRLTAPSPNAYYRLRFGGSHGMQASSSKPAHLWRNSTKITSFTVTPRQVASQGAITISGRLWRHGSSWQPYSGRKVAIQFQYQGKWYVFDFQPRTNSRGYFSGRFTVYVTAKWRAVYGGDTTHFSSASSQIKVTVTSRNGRIRNALVPRDIRLLG